MSEDADERLLKPPVVIESFGDLDGKSRSAIRRSAASAHVEVLANRVRELCAAFDELDADGLSNAAQEALWRAYDLMEDACRHCIGGVLPVIRGVLTGPLASRRKISGWSLFA